MCGAGGALLAPGLLQPLLAAQGMGGAVQPFVKTAAAAVSLGTGASLGPEVPPPPPPGGGGVTCAPMGGPHHYSRARAFAPLHLILEHLNTFYYATRDCCGALILLHLLQYLTVCALAGSWLKTAGSPLSVVDDVLGPPAAAAAPVAAMLLPLGRSCSFSLRTPHTNFVAPLNINCAGLLRCHLVCR